MKISNLQTTIISVFLFIMGLGFDQMDKNMIGTFLIAIGFIGIISVFFYSFINSTESNPFKRILSGISGFFSSSVLFSVISQQTKDKSSTLFPRPYPSLNFILRNTHRLDQIWMLFLQKRRMTLLKIILKNKERQLNHSAHIYHQRDKLPLMKRGRVTQNPKRLGFQVTQ